MCGRFAGGVIRLKLTRRSDPMLNASKDGRRPLPLRGNVRRATPPRQAERTQHKVPSPFDE